MGKMDERPTRRHIVTGDVSEDRTWYSTVPTGRLDEGKEEESEVTREARAGREGGENEMEETRGREAAEEKVEAAGDRRGKERKGKGMRPKCRRRRTRYGCRRSRLRRTRAPGGRF